MIFLVGAPLVLPSRRLSIDAAGCCLSLLSSRTRASRSGHHHINLTKPLPLHLLQGTVPLPLHTLQVWGSQELPMKLRFGLPDGLSSACTGAGSGPFSHSMIKTRRVPTGEEVSPI